MKKILLVGGAGYVGSVLALELLERGYAVRILDRCYYGTQGLATAKDRLELMQGDMRAIAPATLKGIDMIVNIGGLSNDPTAEYNPKANYEMNTLAAVQLAKLCREHGVARYVFASSCSIYDRGVEDQGRDIILDENSPVAPHAAYSSSKYQAEQELLPMGSPDFTVTVLRKGTLYGFSPRMRYDLVVNTFIKDALNKGRITLHYGGEMWRPLADVHDAAQAYIALLQADADKINGQIFNLLFRNFRISEVALRVQETLRKIGVDVEIYSDYEYRGVRNYRVSGYKLESVLGFRPSISIEESAQTMVREIRRLNYTDFDNPRYYNIRWMQTLEEAQRIIAITGNMF